MRSAGCIVNDISDKNFDKLVERTKDRPIASGKISIRLAAIYACLLYTSPSPRDATLSPMPSSA